MINEKNNFLTVSWLSGLLSAEIFISTGEWGGPDATPNLWKQLFSAVRASGGYPGNEVSKFGFNVHGHNIGHIAQLSPNQVD